MAIRNATALHPLAASKLARRPCPLMPAAASAESRARCSVVRMIGVSAIAVPSRWYQDGRCGRAGAARAKAVLLSAWRRS